MSACKIVIVSGIVCTVLLQSTMLCTAKTVHVPLRSILVFALFTRILTKNIKKFLVFPLSFCLLPLLFLPSEEVKSAIGATFSCS